MTASFVIPGSCILDDKNFFKEPPNTFQQLFYYRYVSYLEVTTVLNNMELVKQQQGFIRIYVSSKSEDQFMAYYLVAEFDSENNALLAKLSIG